MKAAETQILYHHNNEEIKEEEVEEIPKKSTAKTSLQGRIITGIQKKVMLLRVVGTL